MNGKEGAPQGLTVTLRGITGFRRFFASAAGLFAAHQNQNQGSQSGDMNNEGYDIVFDHVKFSYDDDTDVLRDVSFTAKQGEVTALIGPSGGGKTTVSRALGEKYGIPVYDIDEQFTIHRQMSDREFQPNMNQKSSITTC